MEWNKLQNARNECFTTTTGKSPVAKIYLAKGEIGLKEVKKMDKEEGKIEIKHTKDKKLKKLLKESMEENIELLRELAKY